MNIKDIVKQFKLNGEIVKIEESYTGNINNTYIISVNEDGVEKKYTLQKVNLHVFKEPVLLMNNIVSVTDYCKNYLKDNDEDFERGSLSVVRTLDGNNFYNTDNGECYRMYNYITNARTYDKTINSEMFYNVGSAFGHFVRMLDKYPIDELKETIPDFHNSKKRFHNFVKDVRDDKCRRVDEVMDEINFIMDRRNTFSVIVDMLDKEIIPYRVTHNDTKINNVLLDDVTGRAICVIDLDTVMPGSALYDFGDAIRSGASTTYEDDTNMDNIGINLEYFKSFTEAYLKETMDILTEKELENLVFACRLLTLELAMRFLNDYINGDIYFKINHDKHNLDRARNQIRLVKEIELHYNEMLSIVEECLSRKDVKKLQRVI